jgi:hypothetical protein
MLLLGSIPAIAKVFPHSNRGIELVLREYNSDFDLEQYAPTRGLCLFRLWQKPLAYTLASPECVITANLSCCRNACDRDICGSVMQLQTPTPVPATPVTFTFASAVDSNRAYRRCTFDTCNAGVCICRYGDTVNFTSGLQPRRGNIIALATTVTESPAAITPLG